MDKLLAQIPKTLLAMLVILGGVFFVILSDPPKTACHSKMEAFRKNLQGHLFTLKVKQKKGALFVTPPRAKYPEYLRQCKIANSPGGCFEWISEINQIDRYIELLGKSCRRQAGGIKEVSEMIWGSLELMNQIAWGEKGPDLEMDRANWFETAELNVFCKMRKRAREFYGKQKYDEFRRNLFNVLPGAKEMDRRKAYSKMLMSIRCNKYL